MNGTRRQIIVNELPYQVNKAALIEKIAELVSDKKITGIGDLRDESDRRYAYRHRIETGCPAGNGAEQPL